MSVPNDPQPVPLQEPESRPPQGPAGATSLRLSVSIVLYRSSPSQLVKTLESLVATWGSAECPPSLAVIDQSQDGPYSEVAKSLCEDTMAGSGWHLQYSRLETNRGYGAGHNTAIQRLAVQERLGDWHLVLNPDVEFINTPLPGILRRFDRVPDAACLAPMGFGAQGAPLYLAKTYPSVGVLALRGFAPGWLRRCFGAKLQAYAYRHAPREDARKEVPLLSGCCMLLRARFFQEVQGFDEQFFMYFEDFDLSLRLAQKGRVGVVQDFHIIHHGGASSRKGWRHLIWFGQSAFRFFNRWGWRWWRVGHAPVIPTDTQPLAESG